jgi:8-oxo-dGTP pyrophosphatase MutT (NUDIX family)
VTPRYRLQDLKRSLSSSLPPGPDPAAARSAAVAALLREGELGVEVLFIRRAEREGDPWSGHMAFPGGRRDPGDADLLATAIRETHEEIGVDLRAAGELTGVLEDQDATGQGTQLALPTRPFVFELGRDVRFTFNHEVTEAVWTPLAPLYSGAKGTTVNVTYRGQDYALPAWDIGPGVVWGLTYRMTSTLLRVLGAPT